MEAVDLPATGGACADALAGPGRARARGTALTDQSRADDDEQRHGDDPPAHGLATALGILGALVLTITGNVALSLPLGLIGFVAVVAFRVALVRELLGDLRRWRRGSQ